MRRIPRRFAPFFMLASAALLFLPFAPQSRAQKSLANNSATFSTLEQEIINELNLARTRPTEYASYLEKWSSYYAGKEFRQPGKPALVTVEGVSALDEAVRFLRAAKPLLPMAVSKGMCSGALELVKEQGASGNTGHRGADGSFCEQRVGRFGSYLDPIGENLSYGDDTARDRVLTLLVDDGVSNRGHRNRIFNPAYKVVGVACGSHKVGPMCVITLAGGFTDNPAGQPGAVKKTATPAPQLPKGAKRF